MYIYKINTHLHAEMKVGAERTLPAWHESTFKSVIERPIPLSCPSNYSYVINNPFLRKFPSQSFYAYWYNWEFIRTLSKIVSNVVNAKLPYVIVAININ